MSLIVEDGSVVSGANAYVGLAACEAYHAARGVAFEGEDAEREAAIVRASAWVDGLGFKGVKTGPVNPMAWPRAGATDGEGGELAADAVPGAVVRATCEAALRELADPGCLLPDLARGGAVASERLGSLEVSYFPGAKAGTELTAVSRLLAGYLRPAGLVELGRG
jgi:hypothetical protein